MFSSSLTRLTESSTISQSFLGFPPDSDWISDRGPKKCHRGRRSILPCFIPIINKKSTRRERICFAVPFFLDLLGIHQNPHSVAGNLFQPSQRIPIHPKVIRRQLIGGRCSVSLWKHAEEYRRFTRPIRSTSGASARESRMVRCQDRRRKPRVAIDILTPLGRFSNWWIFLIFAG